MRTMSPIYANGIVVIHSTREGLLFFASTGRKNIIQISVKVLQLQKILSGSADKSRVNVPIKHETVP